MTEINNVNDIYEKQNEPEFLDLLVAQNYTYKRGKTFSLLCFLCSAVFPTALAIINLFIQSDVFSIISAGIILASLFLTAVFSYLVGVYKEEGAMIQQEFDCGLFGIPSSVYIDQEVVNMRLGEYKDRPMPNKRDWYDRDDARRTSLEGMILRCQEMNVDWTRRTSKRFLVSIAAIIFAVLAISIVVMGLNGWAINSILFGAVTMTSLLSFFLNSAVMVLSEQKIVARIQCLRVEVDTKERDKTLKEEDLIRLQTEIYNWRRVHFLVPEFFERICCRKMNQMVEKERRRRR